MVCCSLLMTHLSRFSSVDVYCKGKWLEMCIALRRKNAAKKARLQKRLGAATSAKRPIKLPAISRKLKAQSEVNSKRHGIGGDRIRI